MQNSTEWTVAFTGPSRYPHRIACSVSSLSMGAWIGFVSGPPLVFGLPIGFGYLSGTTAHLSYAIFCLCVWLGLAAVGSSFRTVTYALDADTATIVIEREGYDSSLDEVDARSENPQIDLSEIRSLDVSPLLGHYVVRVDYGNVSLSRPDTIIIPVDLVAELQAVVDRLGRTRADLSALPLSVDRSLRGSLRTSFRLLSTVLVVWIAPIVLVREEVLLDILVVSSLVIVPGLLQSSVTTVRRRREAADADQWGSILIGVLTELATGVAYLVLLAGVGYGIRLLV